MPRTCQPFALMRLSMAMSCPGMIAKPPHIL